MLKAFRDFALNAAAEDVDVVPPGYQVTPIRIIVDLNLDGTLVGKAGWRPTSIGDTSGKGARRDRGLPRPAPHVVRTAGIRAKLLADNAEYVLGLPRAKALESAAAGDLRELTKVEARHEAFIDLVRACAEATGDTSVQAVLTFLTGAEKVALAERLRGQVADDDLLTFQVNGSLPIAVAAVQAYWAGQVQGGDSAGPEGWNCLVCGEARPILESHPVLIKGVPDTQMGGAAVVSANSQAFESYGLSRSQNGPVCAPCAEGYANGLNRLLADDAHHLRLGGVVAVWWSRAELPLMAWLVQGDKVDSSVRDLLRAPRLGQPPAVDAEAFYAATLSGNAGRIAFRDWLETTVGEVKANVRSYFERQALVTTDGAPPLPIGFAPLLLSLFREARDLQTPPAREIARGLLATALRGRKMPQQTLQLAIRRNRAEQRVTRPRAAMIKLALSEDLVRQEYDMTQLNYAVAEPAYHCGRLLAVLEGIQKSALHGVNTTVVDRYYGAASTSPGTVFPRLLNGAQAHLAKVRKSKPYLERILQEQLAEIVGHITPEIGFPRVLNLTQQGLFALGFYHQKAHDVARMQAASDAKAAKSADLVADA